MNVDPNRPAPPVDFSPLDPSSDPVRMDSLVSAIVVAGMNARRASTNVGVVRQAGHWAMPALAAAALVLAVSVPALVRMGPVTTARAPAPVIADTVALPGRLGLPAPVVALTSRGQSPTPAEIVAAFNSQSRQSNQ
jgi:hypothetical protein